LIIQPLKIFSQEIIFHDGKNYVDADYCNDVINKFNDCRELLSECRENENETVKIVEKIIVQDKVVTEYIEVADKKSKWKGRLEGAAAGTGVSLLIILVLIIL